MNRIAIAAVAVVVALWGTFFFGASYGKDKADVKHAARESAIQKVWRDALIAEVHQRHDSRLTDERKAREATAAHEKALKVLDQSHTADVAAIRRAGGLRIPLGTACTRAAPAAGEAPGTSRPDEGATASVELPERTQERLYALTLRAGQLTEQLIGLQAWVRANGFYGSPDENTGNP